MQLSENSEMYNECIGIVRKFRIVSELCGELSELFEFWETIQTIQNFQTASRARVRSHKIRGT